jgi:arylamine N-acetyltransferase
MDHETVVAYLGRVGVTTPAVSDAASLRTLHRAHQLTVPFENLSIHLAEPISLDEPDLIDKIVRRRRGGFCYELNGAFALLLEALGAQVRRVGIRRGWPQPAPRSPGAHRAPRRRHRALARRRGLRQSQRLSAAAGDTG